MENPSAAEYKRPLPEVERIEQTGQPELSELERKILQIEREWWKLGVTREQVIRNELKISESKYYLLLAKMLDSPRVWQADPPLVDRLRRLRESRLKERRLPDNS